MPPTRRPAFLRFSITSSFAGLLLLSAPAVASPPFTVTLRIGTEVIGPAAALDLVLPAVGTRGVTQAGASMGAANEPPRVAEIWITLPPSPATDRIAALVRAATDGHPTKGSCEIVVAPRDGAPKATYLVSGCFAKSIEPSGGARRVTLGYTTIRVS